MSDNNLVIDVKAILAEAKLCITEDCCIYRVPYDLLQVNVEAYTPMFISIGSLHHFDQRLQNMKKLKYVYFQQFVARSNTKLEDLIRIVKEEEQRLRFCYSENLEMSADELVKVMLVDACFIVELFYQNYHRELTNLMKPRLLFSISLDLLLLENQVPFFILEKLYNLAYASHDDNNSDSFLELSIGFFACFKRQNLVPNFTTCHFTDLLRTFHLQNPSPNRKSLMGVEPIPTATAFSEAGGEV